MYKRGLPPLRVISKLPQLENHPWSMVYGPLSIAYGQQMRILPTMLKDLAAQFQKLFGTKPGVIVRAPGRVNIIGEHTDYNEGWVLPGAMSKSVYILVSKSKKKLHHWVAVNLADEIQFDAGDKEVQLPVWAKYIEGALRFYAPDTGPLNILIGGDLPVGAGVSSSSALTCGLLLGLQKMGGRKDSPEELAMIGSRVEQEVIGLQGGIMDQFAIMLSRKDQVMMLDCRTKKYSFIPATLPGKKWLLINTKVKHQLIDSDYNERAEECARAVRIIQHQYPEIKNVRDVTKEMLASIHLPDVLSRRVRFILAENERVHDMVKALEKKDAKKAGQLLKASHKGLRQDYDVSCDELNHLADFANRFEGVYGARMMGGGFGGCIICLVDKQVASAFFEEAAEDFDIKFKVMPELIEFELSDGVEIIST